VKSSGVRSRSGASDPAAAARRKPRESFLFGGFEAAHDGGRARVAL
jgi:hypothetical protein